MHKQFIVLVVFIFFVMSAHAQFTITDNNVYWQNNQGRIIFSLYRNNILKATFVPVGYSHNEQVSDAVILSPLSIKPRFADEKHQSVQWGDFTLGIEYGHLYFNNSRSFILSETFSGSEFSGFRFALGADEKIYGTGERAISLNRRGYYLPLYNEPHGWYGVGQTIMNYHVPLITSSRNYSVFFDNPGKGYFDIGKKDENMLEYGVCSGELNFYLILGNNYEQLLHSYQSLTGTQPLPPRWSMGNFMSRFGYTSEKQVQDIFGKMKSDKIPFDAVIFDLFWFGDSIKGGLGNLDWMNKKAWPDPKRMIADFKNQGVKTILITEPFILEKTKYYSALEPYLSVDSTGKTFRLTDFYFGYGGLLDIFRKDAQDAFWKYYKKQMDIGVEGWWGDLGEPEKHPAGIHHNLKDFGYNRLFKADEVHNIYGHYWTKMLYTNFEKYYPNKRLFSLNRSGYAGSQRYNIFPWSGDVVRSWSGFQAQLPIMLGMSMCGIPYIHSDAGGFTGGDKDQELYVRWMQFSSFSPVLRPHAFALYEMDPNTTSFPSEAALMEEPYKQIAKASIVNRYHRLPYHYTMCYKQTINAEPLVSPLYYYFSSDTLASKVEDEYMYGRDLLIAPVIEKGATSRNIYLPQGSWYEWKSNQTIKGGINFEADAPLKKTPVYVKAGSFIPLIPDNINIQNTSTYSTSNLDWHYYLSNDSSEFTLYDDDGESRNAIEKIQYELIKASAFTKNRSTQIRFSSTQGNFSGKPASRTFNLIIHGINNQIELPSFMINNKHLVAEKKADGSYVLSFVFNGNEVVIQIKQTLIKQ
jgi:oligosaccharide 4-alpha-D-glucosyltransferase